jgi:folate-binding protein YgfZ
MTVSKPACLLSHRGAIRVGGDDRRAFLQGLISNDIELCAPERAIYAALLTPQGKFLHDLFVVDAGDAFLIDCEAERANDLLQRLTAYKLRVKVTLENVGDAYEIWSFPMGLQGIPDPRLPALGSRSVLKKGGLTGDFERADVLVYDRHRLALGIAEGSRDMIVGKSALAEGNFDFLNGISWTKGCYVGQELTARMHHRGLVKKRLFPVKISGDAATAGSIIRLKDAEIGEMRSSNADLGLALLNVEMAKLAISEGAALACQTARLAPRRPDWMRI